MMDWLQQLDVSLFRFINLTLQTAWLNSVIPFFESKNNLMFLAAPLVVFILIKGGARGRIFVLLLVLSVALTDGVICREIKSAVARPRPYQVILDAHRLVKTSSNVSMPSSHAANWFAGVAVAFIFWRRSLWLMLPLALLVGFGRIYCGVHYPGDVLAGALIGLTTGTLVVWGMEKLWTTLGRKYFPLAWARVPSLVSSERELATTPTPVNTSRLT
ncbi:MAG: phosphatase PAP2 family protein [Verrucomicrobia bacterium]|nr:phosphatase PAP2 family protein [Verrucomicrobiota bacterium]